MPYINTDTGARLYYDEALPETSNGETIVALHGMLGTGRLHLSGLMDWLAGQGYEVIAPTMRGYGRSEPKPRDFPLDFYNRDARDILAFMDALDIERAHVIGYSDGGEITLVCAGRQPERFLTAAAWGAVGYFGPDMRAHAQNLYPPKWLTQKELDLHGIPDANAFVLGWIRAVKHMIDTGGDVSVSLAAHIDCPVLLMLGEADTLNPPAYARVFLEKVRDGRLQMFDCGHAVHEQQPDAFRQALLAHLHRRIA